MEERGRTQGARTGQPTHPRRTRGTRCFPTQNVSSDSPPIRTKRRRGPGQGRGRTWVVWALKSGAVEPRRRPFRGDDILERGKNYGDIFLGADSSAPNLSIRRSTSRTNRSLESGAVEKIFEEMLEEKRQPNCIHSTTRTIVQPTASQQRPTDEFNPILPRTNPKNSNPSPVQRLNDDTLLVQSQLLHSRLLPLLLKIMNLLLDPVLQFGDDSFSDLFDGCFIRGDEEQFRTGIIEEMRWIRGDEFRREE